MIAVSLKEGEDLVKLFLSKGADVNAKSTSSPLILQLSTDHLPDHAGQVPPHPSPPSFTVLTKADSTPLHRLQKEHRSSSPATGPKTSRLSTSKGQARPIRYPPRCGRGFRANGRVVGQEQESGERE